MFLFPHFLSLIGMAFYHLLPLFSLFRNFCAKIEDAIDARIPSQAFLRLFGPPILSWTQTLTLSIYPGMQSYEPCVHIDKECSCHYHLFEVK